MHSCIVENDLAGGETRGRGQAGETCVRVDANNTFNGPLFKPLLSGKRVFAKRNFGPAVCLYLSSLFQKEVTTHQEHCTLFLWGRKAATSTIRCLL